MPDRYLTVFLDDGGVLNDNRLRGPQWARLIGEFMPDRLGGSAEQWASANQVVFPRIWADVMRQLPEFSSYHAFYQTYTTRWMHGMCAALDLPALPDDSAMALYREVSITIGERVLAAIPGASDAVRALHLAGYPLSMASGTPSWELRPILTHLGIADLVTGLYGPDVIDFVKYGPTFYTRIFAHTGIDPGDALVIESDAECCRWASEAGATAIWIDPDGQGDARSLTDLLEKPGAANLLLRAGISR